MLKRSRAIPTQNKNKVIKKTSLYSGSLDAKRKACEPLERRTGEFQREEVTGVDNENALGFPLLAAGMDIGNMLGSITEHLLIQPWLSPQCG